LLKLLYDNLSILEVVLMDRRAIEIDFDIHKRIEGERRNFAESENAILRRLLKLDGVEAPVRANSRSGGREWFGEGVTLSHGSNLRMKYNGRLHTGEIDDGEWLVEGSRYSSPSAAAGGAALTKKGVKTNLDGWKYWQVKRPTDRDWVWISVLRRQAAQRNIT
jgi:hypothetical protein